MLVRGSYLIRTRKIERKYGGVKHTHIAFLRNRIDQKVYTIPLVVYNADCWKHSRAGMARFMFSMNRTGTLEGSKAKMLTDDIKIQYFKGAENI